MSDTLSSARDSSSSCSCSSCRRAATASATAAAATVTTEAPIPRRAQAQSTSHAQPSAFTSHAQAYVEDYLGFSPASLIPPVLDPPRVPRYLLTSTSPKESLSKPSSASHNAAEEPRVSPRYRVPTSAPREAKSDNPKSLSAAYVQPQQLRQPQQLQQPQPQMRNSGWALYSPRETGEATNTRQPNFVVTTNENNISYRNNRAPYLTITRTGGESVGTKTAGISMSRSYQDSNSQVLGRSTSSSEPRHVSRSPQLPLDIRFVTPQPIQVQETTLAPSPPRHKQDTFNATSDAYYGATSLNAPLDEYGTLITTSPAYSGVVAPSSVAPRKPLESNKSGTGQNSRPWYTNSAGIPENRPPRSSANGPRRSPSVERLAAKYRAVQLRALARLGTSPDKQPLTASQLLNKNCTNVITPERIEQFRAQGFFDDGEVSYYAGASMAEPNQEYPTFQVPVADHQVHSWNHSRPTQQQHSTTFIAPSWVRENKSPLNLTLDNNSPAAIAMRYRTGLPQNKTTRSFMKGSSFRGQQLRGVSRNRLGTPMTNVERWLATDVATNRAALRSQNPMPSLNRNFAGFTRFSNQPVRRGITQQPSKPRPWDGNASFYGEAADYDYFDHEAVSPHLLGGRSRHALPSDLLNSGGLHNCRSGAMDEEEAGDLMDAAAVFLHPPRNRDNGDVFFPDWAGKRSGRYPQRVARQTKCC